MNKYISMTNVGYRWYFDNPKVSEEDLAQIHPLSEEYSSALWAGNISDKRHLALRWGEQDWISRLEILDYNWVNDWNADNTSGLVDLLNNRFEISKNEPIQFFWAKESAIETKWGVFLKNWINFLYGDESPILFVYQLKIAFLFSPMGTIYAGKK